jgi:hypothetical protein
MSTKTLAKVNNVSIMLMSENNLKWVPIKPICEALGIDYPTQYSKLKSHEFFSKHVILSYSKSRDGKNYKMTCLPYEYIYGWLLTINPRNVHERAKEKTTENRIKVHQILFDLFYHQSEFLEEKIDIMNKKISEYYRVFKDFEKYKDLEENRWKDVIKAKDFTYEDWIESRKQKEIDFPAEQ